MHGFMYCSKAWADRLAVWHPPKSEEQGYKGLLKVRKYCKELGVIRKDHDLVAYSTRRAYDLFFEKKGGYIILIKLDNGRFMYKRHIDDERLSLLQEDK